MTNPRVHVTGKSTHRTATRPHQPPARNAPVKVRGSDLLIRRLTITDPAVARAAAAAPDAELWVRHVIDQWARADGVYRGYEHLADTTDEIRILMDVIGDWWLKLSAASRAITGVTPDATQTREYKVRADTQLAVVTARLNSLKDAF